MPTLISSAIAISFILLLSFVDISRPARITNRSDGRITQIMGPINGPPSIKYNNGPLLHGNITVNLIWYGKFDPNQRGVVTDFIDSINRPSKRIQSQPDVVTWWNLIQKHYYNSPILKAAKKSFSISLKLGTQITDDKYSLGKRLKIPQIEQLAARGPQNDAINVVLTSADVRVDGFCSICGKHGSKARRPYIWVGNPETQCPAKCAWPLYRQMSGPKTPPPRAVVSPNKDVGMDGLIINFSSQLAGIVTNPFGNGFSQGQNEAASACKGTFARGSYPGFPGNLLVEVNTGASYNAQGVNGRKYLLPAIYNPQGSYCATLI